MKALQIEEATRKMVQAVKDKACLASIEDDESNNNPEESVISAKENAATKTAKWVNGIIVRSEPIMSLPKLVVTSAGNFPLSNSSNFVPTQQKLNWNLLGIHLQALWTSLSFRIVPQLKTCNFKY